MLINLIQYLVILICLINVILDQPIYSVNADILLRISQYADYMICLGQPIPDCLILLLVYLM